MLCPICDTEMQVDMVQQYNPYRDCYIAITIAHCPKCGYSTRVQEGEA